MLSTIEYHFLKLISPLAKDRMTGEAYVGKSKVRVLLGDETVEEAKGKVVVDFGCGEGREVAEIAQAGARKAIGIDIRPSMLERARETAAQAGVSLACQFCAETDELADMVISLDCFEHFAEPAVMLNKMFDLLRPGGLLAASFGPTWYHPLGGHFFSYPFPWAHLILTEGSLLRWREDVTGERLAHFSEVGGGLNRMTIARFERLVQQSPFDVDSLEAVPIRRLRFLHNRLTREFTSAIVRCRLRKPLTSKRCSDQAADHNR